MKKLSQKWKGFALSSNVIGSTDASSPKRTKGSYAWPVKKSSTESTASSNEAEEKNSENPYL